MTSPPSKPPGGYRFLRMVLIVGALGFAVIGSVYLINGQTVPGIFALALAAIEAAALPLFRKLLETSQPPAGAPPSDTSVPIDTDDAPRTRTASPDTAPSPTARPRPPH